MKLDWLIAAVTAVGSSTKAIGDILCVILTFLVKLGLFVVEEAFCDL